MSVCVCCLFGGPVERGTCFVALLMAAISVFFYDFCLALGGADDLFEFEFWCFLWSHVFVFNFIYFDIKYRISSFIFFCGCSFSCNPITTIESEVVLSALQYFHV